MSKKTWAMARGAGMVLIALVIVGGVLLFQKKSSAPLTENVVELSVQPSTIKPSQSVPSGPIVTDNKGVTEVSLPSAPQNVSKPDLEQLKAFRKRSEELERAAATLRKEKRENELVVELGDAPLRVEPLYTFEAQKQGLTGRDSLPEDAGLLYIFQMDDAGRLFGTKGMKFPIDIIWVNNERTVVHISKNVPRDFDGDLKSLWPARYVLEVNGGYADTHGIDVGDTIDLSKIPHS